VTGRQGRGEAAGRRLRDQRQGYADSFRYAQSIIRYGDASRTGRAVQSVLNGGRTELDPRCRTDIVLSGQQLRGVQSLSPRPGGRRCHHDGRHDHHTTLPPRRRAPWWPTQEPGGLVLGAPSGGRTVRGLILAGGGHPLAAHHHTSAKQLVRSPTTDPLLRPEAMPTPDQRGGIMWATPPPRSSGGGERSAWACRSLSPPGGTTRIAHCVLIAREFLRDDFVMYLGDNLLRKPEGGSWTASRTNDGGSAAPALDEEVTVPPVPRSF